jgi:hypothetical protein
MVTRADVMRRIQLRSVFRSPDSIGARPTGSGSDSG